MPGGLEGRYEDRRCLSIVCARLEKLLQSAREFDDGSLADRHDRESITYVHGDRRLVIDFMLDLKSS